MTFLIALFNSVHLFSLISQRLMSDDSEIEAQVHENLKTIIFSVFPMKYDTCLLSVCFCSIILWFADFFVNASFNYMLMIEQISFCRSVEATL